jgi:hypothetical protein
MLGEGAPPKDPLLRDEPLLAGVPQLPSRTVSLQGRAEAKAVMRLGDRNEAEDVESVPGKRGASVQGFSLHTGVGVDALDRQRLEGLCRYVSRPPVATERPRELPDARIAYELRHPWHDGATARRLHRNRVRRKAGCFGVLPPGKLNSRSWHPGARRQVAQGGGPGPQTQEAARAGILLLAVAAGGARPRVLPAARAASVVGGLDGPGVRHRNSLVPPLGEPDFIRVCRAPSSPSTSPSYSVTPRDLVSFC